MKFKFIHKISVIQEKFLVYFNLLRGSDITCSRRDPVCGPCIPGLDEDPSLFREMYEYRTKVTLKIIDFKISKRPEDSNHNLSD